MKKNYITHSPRSKISITNKDHFNQFIIEKDHPCIMAKTIFNSENYQLNSYSEFGSETAAAAILGDLEKYLENYDFSTNEFFSFIAVFDDNISYSEIEFERLLWKQLQKIYNLDNLDWDKTVSNDPNNKSFSFSILGSAFYIVGMHPNSARSARKSPKTSLVFNLHWQFEKLREMGVYTRVRNTIRNREIQKIG